MQGRGGTHSRGPERNTRVRALVDPSNQQDACVLPTPDQKLALRLFSASLFVGTLRCVLPQDPFCPLPAAIGHLARAHVRLPTACGQLLCPAAHQLRVCHDPRVRELLADTAVQVGQRARVLGARGLVY